MSAIGPGDFVLMALDMCEPDTNGGCLLWPGPTAYGKGYPAFDIPEVGRVAGHRAVLEHFTGPIPEGKMACHKCDVRLCIRPDHIYAGTPSENIRDSYRNGRRAPGYSGPRYFGEANPRAKLTDDQVLDIRADARPKRVIAQEYGISREAVRDIKSGRQRRNAVRSGRRDESLIEGLLKPTEAPADLVPA